MGKLFIPRKNSLLGIKRPPLPVEFADQLANWLAIEKWANSLSSGAPPIFDFPGPVVISVTDLFPVTNPASYTKAYLTAVATGTATVAIYKNGSQVGSSINFPAATISTSFTFLLNVLAGDYLQGRVTAAGGGIVGLAMALG